MNDNNCLRTKKNVEPEHNSDANCDLCSCNGAQRLRKLTRKDGNLRTNGDHQNSSNVKIDQKTEKNPGDLRRLAFNQTAVKNISQRWSE